MLSRLKSAIGLGAVVASSKNRKTRTSTAPSKGRVPTTLPHAQPPRVPYPVEHLTPGLRGIVEAIMAMTQAPAAIVAQSVLSATSLACASRAKVETLAGKLANAPTFMLAVADSGERKSAADGIAMRGIERVVLEMRHEHDLAMAEYREVLESLARGDKKPKRPTSRSFLVTEPTIEGAFKTIDCGAGFLGWFTDEAASFWGGHSMSKDQRAKTSGIVSKFWDGAYFFRPRATQEGDGYVPPTPTTLNLMFQPILIRDTYGDAVLIGQGILARMLPAWPESKMGSRKFKRATDADKAIAEEFATRTADALKTTLENPSEKILTLSDGAMNICVSFHDAIEAELGPGGWAADISGFAAKAPEHACRLSAIMTLFEDPAAKDVSPEVMEKACQIVRYHLNQFKYLCIADTNETNMQAAQDLLDWLRRNLRPGDAFSTERVMQFGPIGTRRSKALSPAIDILLKYHWIIEVPPGTKVEGKARKKAYQLSPHA